MVRDRPSSTVSSASTSAAQSRHWSSDPGIVIEAGATPTIRPPRRAWPRSHGSIGSTSSRTLSALQDVGPIVIHDSEMELREPLHRRLIDPVRCRVVEHEGRPTALDRPEGVKQVGRSARKNVDVSGTFPSRRLLRNLLRERGTRKRNRERERGRGHRLRA